MNHRDSEIMKFLRIFGVVAICLLACPSAEAQEVDYKPGEVIVTLAPGSSIDAINAEYGSRTIAQSGDTYLLGLPTLTGTKKIAKKMSLESGVLTAGPNTLVASPAAK